MHVEHLSGLSAILAAKSAQQPNQSGPVPTNEPSVIEIGETRFGSGFSISFSDQFSQDRDRFATDFLSELSASDQKEVGSLLKSLESLYEKAEGRQLTEAEEDQLFEIEDKLNTIFGEEDSIFLAPEQQKRVDSLFGELDKIFDEYGDGELPDDVAKKVDGLFAQIDTIYDAAEEDAYNSLSDADQKRADKLFGELDKLFESATQPEEDGLQALLAQLTQGQGQKLGQVANNISQLFGGANAGTSPNNDLSALFGEIGDVFGEEEVELPAKSQERADQIYAELDKLFGGAK